MDHTENNKLMFFTGYDYCSKYSYSLIKDFGPQLYIKMLHKQSCSACSKCKAMKHFCTFKITNLMMNKH